MNIYCIHGLAKRKTTGNLGNGIGLEVRGKENSGGIITDSLLT